MTSQSDCDVLVGTILSCVARFRVRRAFRVPGGDPGIFNCCSRMLAHRMAVEPSTVVDLLNRLQAMGYLTYTLETGYEATARTQAMFSVVEREQVIGSLPGLMVMN